MKLCSSFWITRLHLTPSTIPCYFIAWKMTFFYHRNCAWLDTFISPQSQSTCDHQRHAFCNISTDLLRSSSFRYRPAFLSSLYTSPLSKVIDSHQGIQHAMYADDTQIYITLKPNRKDDAVRKLSSCLEDIRVWSFNNRLCLNERKSEMIHITSKFRNTDSFDPWLGYRRWFIEE